MHRQAEEVGGETVILKAVSMRQLGEDGAVGELENQLQLCQTDRQKADRQQADMLSSSSGLVFCFVSGGTGGRVHKSSVE